MLMSIACILLLGMMMGWLCKKVHLPGLLGMLVTGIVFGAICFESDRCFHFEYFV